VRAAGGARLAGTLARSRLLELQTPQAAERAALAEALRRFSGETDESTALFRAGCDVAIVSGSRANIKITVPQDLIIAESFIAARAACA
jgi:2-C-methyl-D-erythritol 4-phosphate cytidylyltransferase